MSELWAWGDEEGETWFSNGHHDLVTMQTLAEQHEVEDCGERPFAESELEGAKLSHYWVRWIDEEHGEAAKEGEPGAEPMTSLYLPNREMQ